MAMPFDPSSGPPFVAFVILLGELFDDEATLGRFLYLKPAFAELRRLYLTLLQAFNRMLAFLKSIQIGSTQDGSCNDSRR